MASRASLVATTSGVTNATPAYELIAPTGKGITLLELLVSLAAATASIYALGRPAAKGITPTTPVKFLLEAGLEPTYVQTSSALAWATPPTAPAQFFRKVTFPATVPSSVLWTFPDGLFIPAGGTLVLWNLGTNGVVDISAVVRE